MEEATQEREERGGRENKGAGGLFPAAIGAGNRAGSRGGSGRDEEHGGGARDGEAEPRTLLRSGGGAGPGKGFGHSSGGDKGEGKAAQGMLAGRPGHGG